MKKYLAKNVEYLGSFTAEEVDNLNEEWVACVREDDGSFSVFVDGGRNVILWGDCILCPVGKEARIELMTSLTRVQFYIAAISKRNDPKKKAELYVSWEKEINEDGGDTTPEGIVENDIFDAMLEDESKKVWDWYFKLRDGEET